MACRTPPSCLAAWSIDGSIWRGPFPCRDFLPFPVRPLPTFRPPLLTLRRAACLAFAGWLLGPIAPLPRASAQTDLATWRERADRGDAEALNALGNAYALGQGVPRDDLEARRHYEAAAALGHAPACFNLGLMHELGRGVPRGEAEAARWYRQAAEQNHPRAAYQLAVLLEDGRGVARNEAEAARFYRVAAEQGIGAAQASLGLMMAAGRGGLPVNLPEAHAWLTLAVENGGSAASRDLVAARMNDAQRTEAARILSGLRARFSTLVPVIPVAPEPGLVAVPAGPMPVTAPASAPAGGLAPITFGQVGVSPAAGDTERADLRASVAQLTAENRELSTALRTAESDVRRLEQELAAARQRPAPEPAAQMAPAPDPEKEALAAELAKAQASVAENLKVIAELSDEIDRLKALAASVPALPNVESAPVAAPATVAEWDALRAETDALRGRVEDLSLALDTRTRERDEALAASSSSSQNALWTARLAEANRIAATHKEALDTLTATNADLTREIGDLRRQVAALTGAVQILRGDNARLAAQAGVAPATGTAPVVRMPPPPAPVTFAMPGRAAPSRPGAATTLAPVPRPPPSVASPSPPVPVARVAGPRMHVVAPGETLSEISQRYYGSARRWAEIYEANLDTVRAPHLLRAGQRLRIP